MKQPLVYPKSEEDDKDLQKLIEFYNETLGFCPNSIKTILRFRKKKEPHWISLSPVLLFQIR